MSDLYLLVQIAGRRAAIPGALVQSVVEIDQVVPVPLAPPHVAGLAALRSRALTVIDCAVALGQADAPIPPVKALVVEQDGFLYALSVEEVEDVVWIEEEAHPLPAGRHGGWEQAALGMVGVGGEMLLLADPAGVLDAANSALAPAPALAPADRAD